MKRKTVAMWRNLLPVRGMDLFQLSRGQLRIRTIGMRSISFGDWRILGPYIASTPFCDTIVAKSYPDGMRC
jgi:hypothetical protein